MWYLAGDEVAQVKVVLCQGTVPDFFQIMQRTPGGHVRDVDYKGLEHLTYPQF